MKFVLIIATCLFPQISLGNELSIPWKFSAETTVSANLNTWSDNWERRNSGSFTWICRINKSLDAKLSERMLSETMLRLAFGQTSIRSTEDNSWSSPETTTDMVDFLSILKLSLEGFIDPYASIRMTSQFHDTRDKFNVRFLNPITLTQSFGISKNLINDSDLRWSLRLGGAFRSKIDRDTMIYHSIENKNKPTGNFENSVISDGGTELISEIRVRKNDWLTFNSKLLVYEALILPDHKRSTLWRFPELTWENNLKIDLTKHIMLNYYLQILYDREKGPDPKFRQTFSGGVSMTYSAGS
ncbi:hypothetical protein CHISP_2689 [Chitinispirillum alkaliphilum]|nr:hypothetical protein CHISP_2689 [Chitinispirillum alkaliphilum]